MNPRVVIGVLGSTLDQGRKPERWDRWRPTVALCQHPELKIDRLHLIHGAPHAGLAERVIEDIGEVAPHTRVVPHLIDFKDPWDFEEVYAGLHDFARAFAFEPEREDYLVNITTGTHVVQICWFLLAEAHVVPAQILQLTPPKRWKDRAPGTYGIIDLDLSRYDKIATRFRADKQEATSFLKSGIATRSKAFNHMIERVEQVAVRSKAPMLLMGPTGAGKSQLARRIYELKHARHQVKGHFVEVNCATLRGDQTMSALFGHVKGAFTGAVSDRPGLLRAAHEGVLFLDEIGELGLDEQAMILRAVEDKRFLPVGSDKEAQSDFQLIAGTNRSLAREVEAGRFREDLMARLNLWIFELPGLKERSDDIEPNLDFELARHARLTGESVTFNKEARHKYLSFAMSSDALWTANFRDLSASVTRMATLARAGRIDAADVEEEIARLKRRWRAPGSGANTSLVDAVLGQAAHRLDVFDRVQLEAVIKACRESKSLSDAGRRLFAVSRLEKASSNDADRLKKYLARFGLTFESCTGT